MIENRLLPAGYMLTRANSPEAVYTSKDMTKVSKGLKPLVCAIMPKAVPIPT